MVAQRKRPVRRTKKTVLIVGEGPTEKAFLRYVKELYIKRDMDISVNVECGSGGSPRNVIEKAIRLCGSRGYDKCFVLIDADIPLKADKKLLSRMKRKPKIEILKSTPCIEGLFLSILDDTENNSSGQCKSTFETTYLAPDKKTDKRSYERLFSKEMLNEKRSLVNELNSILKAMGV
ncbi:MAG: RloB family protein [Candidatus Zapsychrus exili]|nr:RloB family protein [Candidatus Zapsychrus exili]